MADKVLVLGANGFAGTHFGSVAERAGMKVVRAAHRGDADVFCDLLDRASLEAALATVAPDAIVNLAGASSVAESLREPQRNFQINATGVLNLLEATVRESPGAQLLCISSGEVYGAAGAEELPLTENHRAAPVNPYGTAKAAMEVICGQYGRSHGLRIAVVRAFNHTGPGQSDTFAVSSFARQIAQAEREGLAEVLLEAGDLTRARDFTDVRDIVEAYRLLAASGLTGTFNACSQRPIRLHEVVDLLQRATELPIVVSTDEQRLRPDEAETLYGSAELLRSSTGWEPTIPLARTTTDLVQWWREQLSQ